MLKNNKGFTLIELMVVVAIIAILATIAGPSYQGFQAKARQKEGMALMNNYFMAAQASYSELGFFPGDFVSTGFAPVGQLGYRLRSDDGPNDPSFGQNDPTCVSTAAMCNCSGMCTRFKTWSEKTGGSQSIGRFGPLNPLTTPVVTGDMFTIPVSAIIKTNSGRDEWFITETKTLSNPHDGLN